MYNQDLSICCEDLGVTILAVGWLDGEHPFPRYPPTETLLDALFDACTIQVRRMRGFHRCQFCRNVPNAPLEAERNGKRIYMGFAEIRIKRDEQRIFAAPTLIYHYVSVHNYEPPKAFADAVIETSLRRAKRLLNQELVFKEQFGVYELYRDRRGDLYLDVLCGDVAQFTKIVRLNQEDIRFYEESGKGYLEDLAHKIRRNPDDYPNALI
jgi:hypothetical protein